MPSPLLVRNGECMEKFGENLPETITIPYTALEELIKFHSNKSVGKILKRMEITDNKEVMKIQVKELLYEQFRDLLDMIIALHYGLTQSVFIFKDKKSEEKEKQNDGRN